MPRGKGLFAADGAPSDAIVVLGCRSPSRRLQRLELGVRLFCEGAAAVLLLSGGGGSTEPEAGIMRRAALAQGIPKSALLVETASRDTLGNARECAALLAARGLHRIVLVTDSTHLPRAALLFRLAGLVVVGRAGVRSSSRRVGLRAAIREAAAWPWSLLRALLPQFADRVRARSSDRRRR